MKKPLQTTGSVLILIVVCGLLSILFGYDPALGQTLAGAVLFCIGAIAFMIGYLEENK